MYTTKIRFMKLLLKIFLIFTLLFMWTATMASWWGNATPNVYLCQWNTCSLEQWAIIAKDTIQTIETGRSFSEYVIDVIRYLVTFLTLIWVIITIYAWFVILTSWWDEEKLKNARKVVFYVILGIALIWFAYWIVWWIVSLLNQDFPAVTTN